MADVYFKCACGKSLAVDERGIGVTVSCVDCGTSIKVPEIDIEFACGHCRASMLAPFSISGDWVRCTKCGLRMVVPGPDADRNQAEIKGHSLTAGEGGDVPARFRLRSRRQLLVEPAHMGLIFRIAMLAALAAAGALILRIHQEPRMVLMAKQPAPRPLMRHAADLATMRELEAEPSTQKAGGTVLASIRAPEEHAAPSGAAKMKRETPISLVGFSLTTDSALPTRPTARARTPDSGATSTTVAVINAVESRSAPAGTVRSIRGRADQPKELIEIMDEWGILDKLRRKGGREAQTEEFVRRAHECRKRLNEYTTSHWGRDLNAEFWSTAFWTLYEYSGCRATSNYAQAEDILREGLDILAGAKGENALVVGETALLVVLHHLYHWLKTNPLECAALVEEYEAQVLAKDNPAITRLWKMDAPLLEAALWARSDKMDAALREEFAARRQKRLTGYLTDPGVNSFTRGKALRSWTSKALKLGRAGSVAQALEMPGKTEAGNTNGPDYYFSRLWMALDGEGDWETARRVLSAATKSVLNGQLSEGDGTYRQMTELYYTRLFFPGYELKRQAAVRLSQGKAKQTMESRYGRK